MNGPGPFVDTRASARAAALSDAISSQVQQIVDRDVIVRAQVGSRRTADVAALHDDFARQVRILSRGTPRRSSPS